MRNLVELLIDRAERYPGLTIHCDGDTLTIATLLGLASGRAQELIALARRREHRPVALISDTQPHYIVNWAACQLAGLPVAQVNPTYPAELLSEMMRTLNPLCLIAGAAERERLSTLGLPLLDAEAAMDHEATVSPTSDADSLDIAGFMHTSGTTAVPKFCAQTHVYFLRLGAVVAESLQIQPGDHVYAPLPLFHINPFGYGVIGALTAGARIRTTRKFSASQFWPTVVSESVTHLVLHAPPVEILKRATSSEDAAGHRIRSMFYADREFMGRFGIAHAVSGYGSTEGAGLSHLKPWSYATDMPDNASRYGGPGRPDIDWRVTTSGVIQVRELAPGALFSGYWRQGRLDPSRDVEGWFDTGDIGRVDAGELVFLERAAESIRVKGEFVPIPFVEAHLSAAIPSGDFALWKRPASLVDDQVVLFVDAEPDVSAIAERLSTLPAFMRPEVIVQIGRIPRDAAAGKVIRRLLDTVPAVQEYLVA